MKLRLTDLVVPALLGAVGVVFLVCWLRLGPTVELQARVPGLDIPDGVELPSAADGDVVVAGQPVRGSGVPSDIATQWPWFRGPNRDSISTEGTRLLREWPAEGPPILWSLTLGEGYASPAVAHGCAYLLDYDEQAQADTLRCLSLNDGQEVWKNSYPVELTRNHGMSRTVPAISGDYVITLGPRCHLACWNAHTGTCRWLIDLARDHGTKVPLWYTGQCPLLDQDRLIVAPCGKSLLMAIDYKIGRVMWESPNRREWTMTHSSIVPMDFQGRRTYVYCGSGGVVGVAADDGTLLWDSTEWPETFATSPSPVILPGDRIFLCSGYDNALGSLVLKLNQQDKKISAETDFELSSREFNSEQHTPILRDNHLFGIRKRGRGQLVCLDLEGNEVWDSGRDNFGHGPFMFADDVLLLMDNDGVLTMAEATPTGYKRIAQHGVIPDGHDAWGPMTIVDGRLLRDMTRMVCVDLRAKP